VNEVQVTVTGSGVQLWETTGDPPVQPAGDELATVRVCVPSAEQVLQGE
jgi:hypothetical protein